MEVAIDAFFFLEIPVTEFFAIPTSENNVFSKQIDRKKPRITEAF